jgi:hypothetical protein
MKKAKNKEKNPAQVLDAVDDLIIYNHKPVDFKPKVKPEGKTQTPTLSQLLSQESQKSSTYHNSAKSYAVEFDESATF